VQLEAAKLFSFQRGRLLTCFWQGDLLLAGCLTQLFHLALGGEELDQGLSGVESVDTA
jgi:hypothetical protein